MIPISVDNIEFLVFAKTLDDLKTYFLFVGASEVEYRAVEVSSV